MRVGMRSQRNLMRALCRMLSAAALLGTAPTLAWGQLSGDWCSKSDGCSYWETHYEVTVATSRINRQEVEIRNKRTKHLVFAGELEEAIEDPKHKKWRISGVFTPPPPWCSEAGSNRDKIGWISAHQESCSRNRNYRKAGELAVHPDGGCRTEQEKQEQRERFERDPKSRGRLTAPTSERKVPRRPHGRFARLVSGEINATLGELAIDLPPMPVLDHKCRVKAVIGDGKLELKKQGTQEQEPLTRNVRSIP
jgi:hypothetical protein